jgi:hypothetical protein
MKTTDLPELAKIPGLANIANEDPLLIDTMAVDSEAGDLRIRNCYTHLKIDGRTFGDSDRVIDTTKNGYTPFLKLYNIALAKAGSPAGDYLTGVKINLGIDNSGKISALYQAVGLNKSKIQDPNLPPKKVQYDVTSDTDYYSYDSGSGTFELKTDLTSLAAYKTKICIVHDNNAGTNCTSFIAGTDVELIIFSFQEIFSLIYDNDSDTISICNAIEQDPSQTQTPVKHSLLLAPDGLGLLSLKGVYANLAHLCPPNCNQIAPTLE